MKLNARRRNRSIQLAVESCEERVVPVGMGTLVGKSLSFLAEEYAAKPLLDNIFGDSNHKEFAEIKKKLDALQQQVAQVQQSIDEFRFTQLNAPLKISAIDTYWGQLEKSLADRVAGNPWPKSDYAELVKNIKDDLKTSITDFHYAFAGTHNLSSEPLMKAYSKVIKGSVTVSKDNSAKTAPFLSSYYSTKMVDAFNYYKDEQTKAMILLVNAYEYSGNHKLAQYTMDSFASPYAKEKAGKNKWSQEVNTMPKFQIPDFMMVDTRTNRAWSQFKLSVAHGGNYVGYYSKIHKEDIPDLWTVKNYLNGKSNSVSLKNSRVDLFQAAGEAKKRQAKTKLPFDWKLPTQLDTADQWGFYTDRGFSSNIYKGPHWIEYNGWIAATIPGADDIEPLQWNGWTRIYSNAVFYETIHTGDFFV